LFLWILYYKQLHNILIFYSYYSIRNKSCVFFYCSNRPSWWEPVLQPKTSKTLYRPVNFSVIFVRTMKINSRIWFGPVNSNFHIQICGIDIIKCLLQSVQMISDMAEILSHHNFLFSNIKLLLCSRTFLFTFNVSVIVEANHSYTPHF
jgi:hypothetical protein